LRVLLVEDHRTVLFGLKHLLGFAGFEVTGEAVWLRLLRTKTRPPPASGGPLTRSSAPPGERSFALVLRWGTNVEIAREL
jgi:hypothetical protein